MWIERANELDTPRNNVEVKVSKSNPNDDSQIGVEESCRTQWVVIWSDQDKRDQCCKDDRAWETPNDDREEEAN